MVNSYQFCFGFMFLLPAGSARMTQGKSARNCARIIIQGRFNQTGFFFSFSNELKDSKAGASR
jgi:hypothetical protein